MDVRAANLKIINAIDGTWDVSAAFLGMTSNALRNRVYEIKGQKLSTDDSLALQSLSKTSFFAQAVSAASGGAHFSIPEAGSVQVESVQAKFNEMYAKIGTLFAEYVKDVSDDNIIDAVERERIKLIGAQMHQAAEELMAVMFAAHCPQTGVTKLKVA